MIDDGDDGDDRWMHVQRQAAVRAQGQTDRQTDRQTDPGGFLAPTWTGRFWGGREAAEHIGEGH